MTQIVQLLYTHLNIFLYFSFTHINYLTRLVKKDKIRNRIALGNSKRYTGTIDKETSCRGTMFVVNNQNTTGLNKCLK